MTLLDTLSEIEKRAEKATPGEGELAGAWGHATGADGSWRVVLKRRPLMLSPESPLSREDATFIALSRRDVPRLCAALRVALAELAFHELVRGGIGGIARFNGEPSDSAVSGRVAAALRGEAE